MYYVLIKGANSNCFDKVSHLSICMSIFYAHKMQKIIKIMSVSELTPPLQNNFNSNYNGLYIIGKNKWSCTVDIYHGLVQSIPYNF